ncbi:hypothetical protein Clacol_000189 [Clathrus columnatus]|uniref:Uncharacterized protein n=1 Tax=Clathrus columnatus TaxID=1419009 RepID=A0AAV4ZWD3_9AGAM|nr:hypothetical protein Clacol_000189 [Clathrus columnatus]
MELHLKDAALIGNTHSLDIFKGDTIVTAEDFKYGMSQVLRQTKGGYDKMLGQCQLLRSNILLLTLLGFLEWPDLYRQVADNKSREQKLGGGKTARAVFPDFELDGCKQETVRWPLIRRQDLSLVTVPQCSAISNFRQIAVLSFPSFITQYVNWVKLRR